MNNFEDIIEKYRRELVEISKQSSVHTPEPQAVPTMAQVSDIQEPEPQAVISGRIPFADYDEFLAGNTARGILRVQVFSADQAFPVPNASVRVFVRLADGERELFSGTSDVDGIADNIRLPAPDSSISFNENSTIEPYAVYGLRVSRPGFSSSVFEGIPVFDSVKSIQPVELVPLSANGDEPTQTVTQTEPMTLFGGEQ